MKDLDKIKSRWFQKRPVKKQMPQLGARELEAMKILWRNGQLSSQQVLQQLGSSSISLSTMQSTLERLHRKELVARSKSGRLYLYTAAMGQSDMIRNLLQDMSMQISDGDMAPMISGFMGFLSDEGQVEEISGLSAKLKDRSVDSND